MDLLWSHLFPPILINPPNGGEAKLCIKHFYTDNERQLCQGVRKNKEVPRDFYANDAIWNAVYAKAVGELKDAMDLAYLTGQRPPDVLVMRRDDIEDKALGVKQKKTHKKLRIMLEVDGVQSGLGALVRKMLERNASHGSPYLLLTESRKRVTAAMLRHRWDDAREEAVKAAVATGDQGCSTGRFSMPRKRKKP